MINLWRPETRPTYRLKVGDVVCLMGDKPEDVVQGFVDNGSFIVYGFAGALAKDVLSDYDEDQEPVIWTKTKQEGASVRLALNKSFSKPLPLP